MDQYHMKDKKRYVYNLSECRKEAREALLEAYPEVPGVFGRMTSYFSLLSSRLDGIELCNEALQYKLLLAVSFMRTHVCACEHIFNSEIIEASTLMRKQLELIARMKEVDVQDLEKLYDIVPNVSHCRPMNVLYGRLSTIAHNANLDSLDMLGFCKHDEIHKHFYIYPIYNENTIAAFDIVIGLFLLFMIETMHLQETILSNYDVEVDCEALEEFFVFGASSSIPFFKSIDVKDMSEGDK